MELDPTQQNAVDMILCERVGIVTGGPGTGKTTILKEALATLPRSNEVICCAPTGKAAKRIMEITGFPAGTVHRILGAHRDGDVWRFRYDGVEQWLPFSVVVVDESSMMDSELAAALLKAVNTHRTRVFFIGDADQLPSVGPGQVFANLIDSNRVPVVRLKTVHRAAGESWVCANAPRILEGDIDLTPTHDFKFYRRLDPEKLLVQTVKLVTKTLPEAGVDDVQVLSPMNGGVVGVEAFNNRIQFHVNPARRIDGTPEPSMTVRANAGAKYHIRARDRVIATSNDYDLMVFNGESGTVLDVNPTDKTMLVDFDGREVLMNKEQARGLRLAYALTVHKSQGSEWDWVVVICHSTHDRMWSRQLLYTAVTRAKKGVMLIGDNAGITIALHNNEPRHRYTSLLDRLEQYDQ